MEWADLLHVLWIGVARDLTGTILMEVAEFHGSDPTYDGRLKARTEHSIRPSTGEERSSPFGKEEDLSDPSNARHTCHFVLPLSCFFDPKSMNHAGSKA